MLWRLDWGYRGTAWTQGCAQATKHRYRTTLMHVAHGLAIHFTTHMNSLSSTLTCDFTLTAATPLPTQRRVGMMSKAW